MAIGCRLGGRGEFCGVNESYLFRRVEVVAAGFVGKIATKQTPMKTLKIVIWNSLSSDRKRDDRIDPQQERPSSLSFIRHMVSY